MGEEVPPRCCCFQFDTLAIKKMKNFSLCSVHCPTHIPMFTWGMFKSHFSASNGLFRPQVGLQPQKTFMDKLSSLTSSRFILISFQKLFSIPVQLKNQLRVLFSLQIHFYEGLILLFTCFAIYHLLSFSFVSLWKALPTPCGSPYAMWSVHLQRVGKTNDTVMPHSGFILERKCCICCKRTNWTQFCFLVRIQIRISYKTSLIRNSDYDM